ncbi:hypothetical protein NPIL_549631, partial [Nephila pilipes]
MVGRKIANSHKELPFDGLWI